MVLENETVPAEPAVAALECVSSAGRLPIMSDHKDIDALAEAAVISQAWTDAFRQPQSLTRTPCAEYWQAWICPLRVKDQIRTKPADQQERLASTAGSVDSRS